MTKEIIFLYSIAFILFIFSSVYSVNLIISKNKIKHTVGTIIDINYVAAKTMKVYNSKWATMSYYIDNQYYESINKLQVSMNVQVGEQLKIKYYIDNPSMLYTRSMKAPITMMIVATICIILSIIAKL